MFPGRNPFFPQVPASDTLSAVGSATSNVSEQPDQPDAFLDALVSFMT
jgi:hypothetical protein